MITKDVIIQQLKEVVAAVKEAREAGVNCLLPDVVEFEDEQVYFVIPLEEQAEAWEREAAKEFSYTFKVN